MSWTGKESPYGYVDWWPHSLYVNNELAPWSDPNVRWALSYYIDREKIVEIAWSGASKVTPLPMPDYPPLQPYFDAVKDLLEQYNTLEYNPAKGDELLTAKGWKKDGNGMWQDENGQPVVLDIVSFFDFTSVGPVVVEMLKRGGIESSYSEPPDFFDNFSTGNFRGCLFGHGGSCREPQETLALYQSSFGGHPWRPCGELLPLEQRRVRQAGRRGVCHRADRHREADGDLAQGDGDLAAGPARHPADARFPPAAVDDQVLDRHARPERPVHQLGPVAPDVPVGAAPGDAFGRREAL